MVAKQRTATFANETNPQLQCSKVTYGTDNHKSPHSSCTIVATRNELCSDIDKQVCRFAIRPCSVAPNLANCFYVVLSCMQGVKRKREIARDNRLHLMERQRCGSYHDIVRPCVCDSTPSYISVFLPCMQPPACSFMQPGCLCCGATVGSRFCRGCCARREKQTSAPGLPTL
jgi:hypothetical protein